MERWAVGTVRLTVRVGVSVQAGHESDEAGLQHGELGGVWRGAGADGTSGHRGGQQVHRQGAEDIHGGGWFSLLCFNSCFNTLFFVLFFIHFIIPFEKFRPPYLGKAAAAARAVIQVYAVSLRVSVIHRTLTWTTGYLTCVQDHFYACIYTQHFDLEKLINICLCS